MHLHSFKHYCGSHHRLASPPAAASCLHFCTCCGQLPPFQHWLRASQLLAGCSLLMVPRSMGFLITV